MFNHITDSIDLQGMAGKTPSLYCVRQAVGRSPGKEIPHLPGGEACCTHTASAVPVNTQRGIDTTGRSVPLLIGTAGMTLTRSCFTCHKAALSYAHNCFQALIEPQRSLKRQQYLTLPVLVGQPSLQWHCSSFCGPFKI